MKTTSAIQREYNDDGELDSVELGLRAMAKTQEQIECLERLHVLIESMGIEPMEEMLTALLRVEEASK